MYATSKPGCVQQLGPLCMATTYSVSLCFLTGYGERGAPPKIPGNTLNTLSHHSPRVPDPSLIILLPSGGATLVFEVELLKIERRSEL